VQRAVARAARRRGREAARGTAQRAVIGTVHRGSEKGRGIGAVRRTGIVGGAVIATVRD
jgi:hypothetical protein